MLVRGTLEMIFITAGNKEVTVVVKDRKDDLTLAAVQAVMDTIVAKEAQIRQFDVIGLAVDAEAIKMEELIACRPRTGFRWWWLFFFWSDWSGGQ